MSQNSPQHPLPSGPSELVAEAPAQTVHGVANGGVHGDHAAMNGQPPSRFAQDGDERETGSGPSDGAGRSGTATAGEVDTRKRGSGSGVRSKNLRFPVIPDVRGPLRASVMKCIALSSWGRQILEPKPRTGESNLPSSGPATPAAFDPAEVSETAKVLMRQAESAPTYEEAFPFVAEAVTVQLLEGMKGAKISKSEQSVAALKRSGLDALLVEALLGGRLTHRSVDRHLNRMREAIKTRSIAVQDIKEGILAFDAAAQRLAWVGGERGAFEFLLQANHARDSLVTFARALHR